MPFLHQDGARPSGSVTGNALSLQEALQGQIRTYYATQCRSETPRCRPIVTLFRERDQRGIFRPRSARFSTADLVSRPGNETEPAFHLVELRGIGECVVHVIPGALPHKR